MTIRRISTGSPWEPKIGYCRAVVAQGVVYVSGCTGTDRTTQTIPPDVRDQCRNALKVVAEALAEAGTDFAHVVRVHYILPDWRDFEACWPILAEVFGPNPPAATMFEAALIVPDLKFEIEVTAVLP